MGEAFMNNAGEYWYRIRVVEHGVEISGKRATAGARYGRVN
jgi:hypothetical protein